MGDKFCPLFFYFFKGTKYLKCPFIRLLYAYTRFLREQNRPVWGQICPRGDKQGTEEKPCKSLIYWAFRAFCPHLSPSETTPTRVIIFSFTPLIIELRGDKWGQI